MPITTDDLLRFCHRTIDGMIASVERLDDEQVNTAPDLPGANTPFQLVTHALAAAEFWIAHHVCGRPTDRVRDDEFRAVGTVAELVASAGAAKQRLEALGDDIDAATAVHQEPDTQNALGAEWTIGACLIHAYEELAQHLGHLELTTDLLAST